MFYSISRITISDIICYFPSLSLPLFFCRITLTVCKCVFGHASFYFVGWRLNFCCASIVWSFSFHLTFSLACVCVCVCVRRHKTVCGEKRAPRPVKNNVYLFVCSLACECVRMIVYGKIHTLGVSE